MEEELNLIIEMSKESMKNSIDYLEKKLLNIRAGKANPNMLSSVIVDYYGAKTPLAQMANINTPDAKTLIIQPWDKTALEEIEKAIEIANIGFNPMNNGDNIIISVPALTEERRIQLVKQVKSEIEDAKISVRNARKDANNEIKKSESFSEDMKKNAELDIQEITNNFISKIDQVFEIKQKESTKLIINSWKNISCKGMQIEQRT